MADLTVTASQVAIQMTRESQIRSRTCAVAITAGQAIYYDTNGKVNPADADGGNPLYQFDGIALDTCAAGEVTRVIEEGWMDGYDLSGLAYNADVWLSTTPGALATAPPVAGAAVKVARVDWRNDAGGSFGRLLRINRHPLVDSARNTKIAVVPLVGATVQGGVQSWQNPEGASILVQRTLLNVTTQSTGAGTVSIGTTATSATTSSANLLDTLSVAAAGLFDNITDKGTNGKSRQSLAAGKWVTIASASGDVTGMVANLYIEYILA